MSKTKNQAFELAITDFRFCGTPPQPPRQSAVEWWHATINIIASQIWQGSRDIMSLYMYTMTMTVFFTIIFVTSACCNRVKLPPTWITILPYLCLSATSSFEYDTMSPSLAPGINLTMVAGVANFRFLKIEMPIMRVGFSVGVWLSGDYLFETWTGWWWTMGFCLGPRFSLQTVTQLPWLPGCPGAAEGGVTAETTLGRLTPATGSWITTAAYGLVSMMRSFASGLLTSIAANKPHLWHVQLLLKEAEL